MKHKLKGVCAKEVNFRVTGGRLKNVKFSKGCPGNLEAIASLTEGMLIEEVISRLRGIACGKKKTSCSDQFAKVLKRFKKPAK